MQCAALSAAVGMPDLTEVQVAQAVAWVGEGVSRRAVAQRLGVAPSVINRAIKRYEDHGTMRRLPGQGRPRKTTAAQDRRMVRTAVRERFVTARKLASEHAETTGVNISSQTVRRRLHAADLRGRVPKKAPKLTAEHKAARRLYVEAYGDWGQAEWRHSMFSDEVRFGLHQCDGRVKIWRRQGERDQVFQERVAYEGGSLMFWGAIQLGWKSELVLLPPPGFTAARYVNEVVLPHVVPRRQEYGAQLRFQQDGARPHTAHHTMGVLQQHDIELINHPSLSPDLNPIEHAWDELDRRIRKRVPQPQDIWELLVMVLEEWDGIEQAVLDNLINSMPRRVTAVRRARGGNTTY